MSAESQNNSLDKLLGKRFGKVQSLAIPSLIPAAESLAKQFSTLDTLKIISPPFRVDGLSALVERQQDFQSWAKFVFSRLAPLREVRTASDATAEQILAKHGRVNRVIKHLGSALDETKLQLLPEKGRRDLSPWQLEIDLFDTGCVDASRANTLSKR